jgi:hypothetical protein
MIDLGAALSYLLAFLIAVVMDLAIASPQRERRQPKAAYQLIATGLAGFGAGLMLGHVVHQRLLPSPPFPGVSVLVVPFVLGAAMHAWGRLQSKVGKEPSRLATWYGGGLMGLGLAVGRLLGLRLN